MKNDINTACEPVHEGWITDVSVFKLGARRDVGPGSCRKIIEDDNANAMLEQPPRKMGANKPSSPGNQRGPHLKESQYAGLPFKSGTCMLSCILKD